MRNTDRWKQIERNHRIAEAGLLAFWLFMAVVALLVAR